MPKLSERPNGIKVRLKGKSVMIKVESSMYKDYVELDKTAKVVFDLVLKYMEDNTNLIIFKGDTLDRIMEESGYNEQVIANAVSRLKKKYLIEPTKRMRREYIVNPLIAVKGNEFMVWNEYGKIERLTNPNASVMSGGVELPDGDVNQLGDKDYELIGRWKVHGKWER